MWHGPFRVVEKCGDHAVRLAVAGTPYRLFPVVPVSKLKLMKALPERPQSRLNAGESNRFDFDEALLQEDIWEGEVDDEEFEVKKIVDVRSGRKKRYGRVHRHFVVY